MDSLLSICDIKEDVFHIIDLAIKIKAGETEQKPLAGKTLAMIFEKSSTRTRISWNVSIRWKRNFFIFQRFANGQGGAYLRYCTRFKSFR